MRLFRSLAFFGAFSWALLGEVSAAPRAESPYNVTLQMGRVLVQVENDYVEPVERQKLVDGAIKGMVEELDPHSSYMPPQEFSAFEEDTEGKFAGVGVEVDVRAETITVIAPIEGSPAERAGVKSGDKIVAVDGDHVLGASLDKLVKKMRGRPGTHVKITVRRDATKDPINFDLVREVIHVPSVTSKLLTGNVAYVRIKQFQDKTHDELLRAAAKLAAASRGAPLTGVLLDLRSNPGGLVDEAAEVADEFLNEGGIYTTRHRGEVIDDVRARHGGAFSTLPVVLLVNEWSASASELVAGALQDDKRALVVGANTFGKGSVQSIIELPGGAGLRLTTARYYTPSGHSIQADGIHPDVPMQAGRPEPDGLPPIRERDLEGHLPAEGVSGAEKTDVKDAGAAATIRVPDGGDLEPEDTRALPMDPTKSNDFALKTGWQILRDRLVGKGPIVR
jgi:carboxyl-terminal processing protease